MPWAMTAVIRSIIARDEQGEVDYRRGSIIHTIADNDGDNDSENDNNNDSDNDRASDTERERAANFVLKI